MPDTIVDELINDEQFIVQLYPDTFAIVIATYLALSARSSCDHNRADLDRRMIGVVSSSDRTEILKELRAGVCIDDANVMCLGEIKRLDVSVWTIRWVISNVGAVIAGYHPHSDYGSSGSGLCPTLVESESTSELLSSRSSPTPRKPRKRRAQRQCRSARDSTSEPLLQEEQILIIGSTDDHFSVLRIENFPQNALTEYIIPHCEIENFSSPHVLMFDVSSAAAKKNDSARSSASLTSNGARNHERGCVVS